MHALSVLALASAASASLLQGRQTPTGACATSVHVIAIGGANSPDEFDLGLLKTLATNITAALPGSDYSSLPYDKVEPRPHHLHPGAITAAVDTLGQYVADYHAACPDSKIAIIGYSAGAAIASLALCTIFSVPQSLARNTIIANIEYGAQTRVPYQPYNVGTCIDGAGTQPLTNPEGCGAYIPLTQSYCDVNDPECCDGPPRDFEIHFVYPEEYDLQATDYVVSQYKKFGGNAAASMSKSSTHKAPAPQTKTKSSTSISTSKSKTFIPTSTKKTIIPTSSKAIKTTKTTHKIAITSTMVFPSISAAHNSSTTPVGGGGSGGSPTMGSGSGSPVNTPPASSSPPPSGGGAASLKPASLNGPVMVFTTCIGAMMIFGAALL